MGKRKRICGIYCIENILNGRKYIGQSVDIQMRFYGHKSKLNRNIHDNQHLQFAWNKYKENNFKFYIIEKCNKNLLNEREIYWIDLYGTEKCEELYNIAEGGYANPYSGFSEEERKILHAKQAESHRRNGKSKGANSLNAKKIICLNTGEIFNCEDEALEKYNLTHGTITTCCRGERKSAGKHPITGERLQWSFYDKNKIYEKPEYINDRARKVKCLNTGQVFPTLTSACEWCNLRGVSNIMDCCKGKRKHAGRHPVTNEQLKWEYIDE